MDTTIANPVAVMAEALRTTAGNIRSIGPAGALKEVPMPYREWLKVVEDALATTDKSSPNVRFHEVCETLRRIRAVRGAAGWGVVDGERVVRTFGTDEISARSFLRCEQARAVCALFGVQVR